MSDGAGSTVGRVFRPGLRSLFSECVVRAGDRTAHRDLPVTVLVGRPGSGRASALDDVAHWCGESIPYALISLSPAVEQAPSHIAVRLAYQLAEQRPQYGRVPFPRLMLCLAVAAVTVNATNRAKAWEDVRPALAADAKLPTLRRTIDRYVGGLTEAGVLPRLSGDAASLLLDVSEGLRWRRRLRYADDLGPGRAGAGAEERRRLPREALIQLGLDTSTHDAVFCRALLADLRAAYRHGIGSYSRTVNCVALLDNVDTPSGRQFLACVTECRRTADDGDPLAIFGTSGSWPHWWNPCWSRSAAQVGDRRQARTPDAVSLADWQAGFTVRREPASWVYPVLLPDLSAAEVTDLATATVPPLQPQVAAFVHRLTGGHPHGTTLVLAALTRHATPHTALRTVLADEELGGSEPAMVAEVALARLLRDFPAVPEPGSPEWTVLMHLAVATDLPLGMQLADRQLNETGAAIRVMRLLRARLLVNPDGAGEVLDPWLRRLLLHRLAATDDDEPTSWRWLHIRHRNHHHREHRHDHRFRHELAIGEPAEVIRSLAADLAEVRDRDGVRTWKARLAAVTAAPNRLPPEVPAHAYLAAEPLAVPEQPVLTRLVLGTWLLGDPLADPLRALEPTVQTARDHLAAGWPGGEWDDRPDLEVTW